MLYGFIYAWGRTHGFPNMNLGYFAAAIIGCVPLSTLRITCLLYV